MLLWKNVMTNQRNENSKIFDWVLNIKVGQGHANRYGGFILLSVHLFWQLDEVSTKIPGHIQDSECVKNTGLQVILVLGENKNNQWIRVVYFKGNPHSVNVVMSSIIFRFVPRYDRKWTITVIQDSISI